MPYIYATNIFYSWYAMSNIVKILLNPYLTLDLKQDIILYLSAIINYESFCI